MTSSLHRTRLPIFVAAQTLDLLAHGFSPATESAIKVSPPATGLAGEAGLSAAALSGYRLRSTRGILGHATRIGELVESCAGGVFSDMPPISNPKRLFPDRHASEPMSLGATS